MNGDTSEEMWQPRFYLACALSVTLITVMVYSNSPGDWWSGAAVGWGVASVLGLIFLAVQHWSLVGSAEVEHAC